MGKSSCESERKISPRFFFSVVDVSIGFDARMMCVGVREQVRISSLLIFIPIFRLRFIRSHSPSFCPSIQMLWWMLNVRARSARARVCVRTMCVSRINKSTKYKGPAAEMVSVCLSRIEANMRVCVCVRARRLSYYTHEIRIIRILVLICFWLRVK